MLEAREITRETLLPLLNLKVRPDQEHLVAPTAFTIAQHAYEPGSAVWGLWDGEKAIGLVAMLDPRAAILEKGDHPEAAYIWRLLIDAEAQGKGYGRAAIGHCIAQTRHWGLRLLATSVVNTDDGNLGFYQAMGFRRTGTLVDGEVYLLRDV